MADLNLLSERQIQSNMLSTLIAELGLNDLNPGSVIEILTQAIAQQDFALMYRIAQVSRLTDIKNVKGDDLDTLGFTYGLIRKAASNSSGLISILRESTFEKVSTNIYSGFPSPTAGTSTLYVVDASNVLIGTSGTLIVGRGTLNEEEVTYSSAPTINSNYAVFTLDSPFLNSHNSTESVILKQGLDVTISAGTIVRVPATATTSEIQFKLDNDAILYSGEEKIENVAVTAVESGTLGNIPAYAISGTVAFPSPPFNGARAENTSKFTNGTNRESDDSFRDRIMNAGDTLTKGVKQAVLQAIVGLVDPNTAKRVVSASVVLPTEEVGSVKVYIDDGTGFEPTFGSIGYEEVRKNATGGEKRLQLDQFPIVKASLETTSVETYDMSSGPLTLIIEVGVNQETITFNPADFNIPELGTAEEIVTVINDQSTIVEARTSQSGQKVLINGLAETNEEIQVIGGTANTILNFPTTRKETLGLYLNDIKLSKDGETATLESQNLPPYNIGAIGALPQVLTITVDGKTSNVQTATLDSSDVDNSSTVTAKEIVDVINRDVVGVVASVIDGTNGVRIQSLTKLSENSKLQVTSSGLNNSVNGLNMVTTEVVGKNKDYTLNRELGLVELEDSLISGDTLTAGTPFTRAFIRASLPENYAPSNGDTLVIIAGDTQTVTFDATFASGKTAQETADFINNQLNMNAFARVRSVSGQNYLEIVNSSFSTGNSIEIDGTSTGNAPFGFTLDSPKLSIDSNTAFLKSNLLSSDQQFLTGFNFNESDNLVVVLDQLPETRTYNVPLYSASSLTGASSTTVFSDTNLPTIFENSTDLEDWHVTFTSGANTGTRTITSVSNSNDSEGSNIMTLVTTGSFSIAVGDVLVVSGLSDSVNNGKFFVASVSGANIGVYNPNGINSATESGTATVNQRRVVSAYNNLTGQLTVGSAFSNTPAISDSYYVSPNLSEDVVSLLNNLKITSLSQTSNVQISDGAGDADDTNIEISSKEDGSNGAIQVTGGLANREFRFSTIQKLGVSGYDYWTGLIDLVHKVIYGDDTDLVTYPGVGAAGVNFQILAPTVREMSVNLTITLQEGITITSVENEVKSAVSGYINSLGVGEDVIIEEIRASVIRINGVIDVSLSDPTINIAISDNELARISTNDIIVG